MDLTLLEKFAVGNTVAVADNSPNSTFEGLKTYAMKGCVQKIDYKAGVCVQPFISRIFQPCFWYQPSSLALNNEPMPFVPCDWSFVQVAMGGGPGQVKLPKNSIITGALRSWLVSKSNAKPGQSLYVFVSKMTWEECINIYQGGESLFVVWLKANYTRVRRPQMLSVTDANTIDITANSKFRGPLSAKRPKMG